MSPIKRVTLFAMSLFVLAVNVAFAQDAGPDAGPPPAPAPQVCQELVACVPIQITNPEPATIYVCPDRVVTSKAEKKQLVLPGQIIGVLNGGINLINETVKQEETKRKAQAKKKDGAK